MVQQLEMEVEMKMADGTGIGDGEENHRPYRDWTLVIEMKIVDGIDS